MDVVKVTMNERLGGSQGQGTRQDLELEFRV